MPVDKSFHASVLLDCNLCCSLGELLLPSGSEVSFHCSGKKAFGLRLTRRQKGKDLYTYTGSIFRDLPHGTDVIGCGQMHAII